MAARETCGFGWTLFGALSLFSDDYLFKLLLTQQVGDPAVGKTSLLLRFHSGVDLKVKLLTFMERRLKLTIWDTAGQERFRTLSSSYYRGAHGIILVFDVTSQESFEHLKHWMQEIDVYSTNAGIVTLLVGNKIDEESRRVVTKQQGLAFARANNMLYIETSAKTQVGVQQAFEELLQKILDVPELLGEGSGSGSASGASASTAKLSYDDKGDREASGGGCGGWCGGA